MKDERKLTIRLQRADLNTIAADAEASSRSINKHVIHVMLEHAKRRAKAGENE